MKFDRIPLRRVVREACDGPFGSSLKSQHYTDAGARVVRLGNIGSGEWIDQDEAFVDLDHWHTLSRHHAEAGDLMVAGLGDENHPLGRACVLPKLGPAMVKADCYRLRLDRTKADPGFIALYLSSAEGEAAALRLADGATRARLTLGKALTIPVPDIPMQQQLAIASYLGAETARIDGLVSARARQLDLIDQRLEAEAAALLRTPETPLVALRRVVDLLPGFSYGSEDFLAEPDHARLLRGINVDTDAVRWDDAVWVKDRVAASTSRFALAVGDIVMGMDRPVISSGVRIAQVTAADLPALLVQRVARLRARPELSQAYLWAALRGPGLADHFVPLFTGVSVPHVSPSQILSYEIPLPSVSEQDGIVRALSAREDSARRYRSSARRQIELLLERRQALVTAAVTGQLDIHRAAA